MSRLLSASLIAACCALGATQARADTVDLTNWTYSGVNVNVHVADTHFNYAGQGGGFSGALNGAPIATYCLDLYQEFYFGGVYSNYTVGGGTLSSRAAQDIGRLVTQDGGKVVDANSSAAFQLALWEVLYESPATAYNLNSGNFTGSGGGTSTALANSWLNGLGVGAASNVHVQRLYSAENQDFLVITAVPEPSNYAMFGAGLGLLAFLSRRKRGA
ncbi:hypothetical protein AAKU55_001726 [Oxalobacteraceae bacterium GrIS 1.11]